MGCSHSQFDSGCASCMLQFEQAESAHWAATEAADQAYSAQRAANEAFKQRIAAEDHYRRMERSASRQERPQGGRAAPARPGRSSDSVLPWVVMLGAAIVVGFGAVAAFVASVAAAVAQVLKLAVVAGIVLLVLYFIHKHRDSPRGPGA